MSIASLSKYIISFLFAVLVVLSVLLAITQAENKTLQKTNAVLKEQLVLRDTAINEIDKNIAYLKKQVHEAESICEERLKARENLLTFLSIEPTYNVGKNGTFFPETPSNTNWVGNSKAVPHPNRPLLQGQVPQKCDSATLDLNNKVGVYEVISKNKSDYAVNAINNYWVQFTQSSDSKK